MTKSLLFYDKIITQAFEGSINEPYSCNGIILYIFLPIVCLRCVFLMTIRVASTYLY